MTYEIDRLSDYSKETLKDELRRVGKKLKKVPTKADFNEFGRASASVVQKKFGSWNRGLSEAGLPVQHVKIVSREELFAEIEKVWKQFDRRPTQEEMNQFGKFKAATYKRRFGSWIKACEEFVQWNTKADKGESASLGDLKEIRPEILTYQPQKPRKAKKVEYGEPIDFEGLRHAPINEQGVVYLFGMLSSKLGFIIEAVRADFPDCEGKRRIHGEEDRWERVSIEFEYKSKQFKRDHKGREDDVDVIVCWEDNWKDCPIKVVSLKTWIEEQKMKSNGRMR
jgi:hypothetical protein